MEFMKKGEDLYVSQRTEFALKIVSIGRRKLSYLFPFSMGNAFALFSPAANNAPQSSILIASESLLALRFR